ncbi:hypothetical protein niasHT_006071 [Heterodera trifolii]|uniref:Transposase n=1 Tax=Heterodera trifolii TaxID=157864 RepID=A0ABD2M8A2_9BILA
MAKILLLVDPQIICRFILATTIFIGLLLNFVAFASARHHHHQHNHRHEIEAVSVEQQAAEKQQRQQNQQQYFFDIDGPMLEGQQRHQRWRHNLQLLMTMQQQHEQRHGLPKHRRETDDLLLDDVERSAGEDNEQIESNNGGSDLTRGQDNGNSDLVGGGLDGANNGLIGRQDNSDDGLIRANDGSIDELIGEGMDNANDELEQEGQNNGKSDLIGGLGIAAAADQDDGGDDDSQQWWRRSEYIATTAQQQQQQTMSQSFLLLVASCAVFVALALSLAGFALFYYVSIIHRGGFACWAITSGGEGNATKTDYYDGTTTIITGHHYRQQHYAEIGGAGDKSGRRQKHHQYSMSNSTTVMTLADEEDTVAVPKSTTVVATGGGQLQCCAMPSAVKKTTLLSVLKQNRRWSLDGTFRSAPKPWMQVFVIGCYVNNRMVVAAQALLPVMSDFEIGMLKAMRHVFPSCERSGCSFHMAQAVFRKARSMGIFNLLNEDDDEVPVQRKSVHKTFRSVLSLALIPPDYVRHAFSIIVNAAPLGVQGWLAYFGKTYIGTTQFEIDRGAEAFGPNSDVGRFFLRRAQSTTRVHNNKQWTNTIRTAFATTIDSDDPIVRRKQPAAYSSWEQDIVCPPRFPISFWNVYTRAQMAIERTNNGMEAAHGQFARELNHHPSLSDFIAAFIKDIDKQLDIGRAERLQKSRKRPQRYIIKEQSVVRIIDEADFESEEGLTNALYLIGLVMQGFVEGLHVRENEDSEEETDDTDGN